MNIFLAILLRGQRQTGRRELLAHPAVAQDHKETAHDAEVAEEEVEVEDEAVAEGLGDDDPNEAKHGVFGVFADDDQRGAADHGDDIEEKE